MRIAITGATGLVGHALTGKLIDRGDSVVALTRDPERALAGLPEGTEAEPWIVGEPVSLAPVLDGLDAVVNLAGEPVFGRRWNRKVREELRRSRIEGTRTVVEAMRTAKAPPRVLVNASAIGYYGHREEPAITEAEPPGDDFLARLCVDWEAEAARACELGARVVMLRIGLVLAAEGGALAKMLPPLKMFVGGRLGNGRQGTAWIHVDDLVGLILHALDEQTIEGPMNATAPNPLSNAEFTRALGRVIHRPVWLPAPKFALRLVVGPAAGILTTGQFVVPEKALATGYEFRFPQAEGALRDLLSRQVETRLPTGC